MRRPRATTVLAALIAATNPAMLSVADTDPPKPTVTQETIPHLAVRGEAQLQKPADELRLSAGVVTEHADAQQALRQNSERMRDVVQALARAGLTEEEYETGRFAIEPVYSRPGRGEPEWRPRIVSYRVTNTVNVRTKQIDEAGQFIQAASDAGANTIDSIRFTLAEPRVHRAEAIAAAAGNAIADAEALAGAARLRLVRILSITLDEAQPIAPPVPFRREMAVAAEPDAPPPIMPGEVTVRANVRIVYEIAPAD